MSVVLSQIWLSVPSDPGQWRVGLCPGERVQLSRVSAWTRCQVVTGVNPQSLTLTGGSPPRALGSNELAELAEPQRHVTGISRQWP